jgi:hypothetical protein
VAIFYILSKKHGAWQQQNKFVFSASARSNATDKDILGFLMEEQQQKRQMFDFSNKWASSASSDVKNRTEVGCQT